jgi:hypothetical protein
MTKRNGGGDINDKKKYTWELVDRPPDKNIIGVKLVFRTKLNIDQTDC